MIKAAFWFILYVPFFAVADGWLVGGQVLSSGAAGGASFNPDAPLLLNHDATQSNEAVNLRTASRRVADIVFTAQPLTATNGLVWVDIANGYNQRHEATGNVTFAFAGRTDTNVHEAFLLHVLAQDVTISFATNHLNFASLSRLDVSSNEVFSFSLLGLVGQDRWFITEHHRSMAAPSPFGVVVAGLTNGLVFYANFEDSAHDLTGKQTLRGTNTTDGSAVVYSAGPVGLAARFDATNRTYFSYTNTPVSADAPLWANGNGFTVAWWEYKLDIAGDFIDVLLVSSLDGVGPWHNTLVPFQDQDLSLMHYVNDEYVSGRGPTQWWLDYTAPANAWVHMAFTFDNSGMASVYVNGVYQESASQDLGVEPSGHFIIGNQFQYAHWTYNGFLDEVSMWNRVLSELEIQAVYNHGAGRPLIP